MLRTGAIKKRLTDTVTHNIRQVVMKFPFFSKLVRDMKRDDARATSLAVGALLVVSILYATTMVS